MDLLTIYDDVYFGMNYNIQFLDFLVNVVLTLKSMLSIVNNFVELKYYSFVIC